MMRRCSRNPGRGQICDTVSIRKRPARANDRPFRVTGRLISCTNSQITPLVERKSRFVMLIDKGYPVRTPRRS